jgi:hypothetical protein
MGASDVSVDGCLQSGYGNNRCLETGEEFSSTKYKSHWCVPETVAHTFDQ